MSVRILINEESSVPNRKAVAVIARRALRAMRRSGALSITFTNDAAIQKLNKQYRFRDKATDVLSFPMNEDGLIGDIVISVPTARRNTVLFGTTFPEELLRLTVHGILHVCGHTHKTRVKKSIMSRMENKILGRSKEVLT